MENLEIFIQDLVNNYGEFTRGDLQAVVEARCMRTGESSDAILQEIDDRIDEETRDITQDESEETKIQIIKFYMYDNIAEPFRTELKNKYIEKVGRWR